MRDGFVVQVLRPAGAAVCRLHLRRVHLAAAGMLLVLTLFAAWGLHERRAHDFAMLARRLDAERSEQQRRLERMERQALLLQRQNAESQRSIEQIERRLGGRVRTAGAAHGTLHALLRPADPSGALAARLAALALGSARTRAQTQQLAGLASRVLNMRRLASIARARTLAAIPSLNPVNGDISAGFGWRTNPWPEFHKGLDLAADYGTPVRASAAGVVVSAGWVGGYGIRVDVDHGNGYHTWYCHLSRTAVVAGQHVAKGQTIAAVGSTGESTGPHLHYQLMHDGVAIDPRPFLNGVPSNVMASLPQNADVQ